MADSKSVAAPGEGGTMASFVHRMIGAAKLDVATFEEVKADPEATVQSIVVVLLSAAAAGIGALRVGATYAYWTFAISLVAWVVWAFVIWLIGAMFLAEAETDASVDQLMRPAGFATSPGIISVLGWIPYLGALIPSTVAIWVFAATVVAVRQALSYKGTARAILVCTIPWIVLFIIYFSFTLLAILHGGL
jgi:hypothetical protein